MPGRKFRFFKVINEQRFEGSKGLSPVVIWGESVPGEGTARPKSAVFRLLHMNLGWESEGRGGEDAVALLVRVT